MIEVDVRAADGISVAVIDQVIQEMQLSIPHFGTVRKYRGCHHWHLKNGPQGGTLELTWWPEHRRLWFKIAKNRRGEWMDEVMSRFQQQLFPGD